MENLEDAVLDFALLISPLTEADLATPWAWGSYQSEGVRFGVFRVNEELLQLAARLGTARKSPRSEAEHILGTYHQAARDLQGALWGVDDQTGMKQPGGEEWPVQVALAHLVQGDLAFYAMIAYALERLAAGDESPPAPEDEDYDRILNATEEDFHAIRRMPVSRLQVEFLANHARSLKAFAGIPDEVLGKPARYWEQEAYPIRFRLQRLGSHLRQHTIQIDKTLAAVGKPPVESKMLVRMLLNALAEAENQAMGETGDPEGMVSETAAQIQDLTEEIRQALEK